MNLNTNKKEEALIPTAHFQVTLENSLLPKPTRELFQLSLTVGSAYTDGTRDGPSPCTPQFVRSVGDHGGERNVLLEERRQNGGQRAAEGRGGGDTRAHASRKETAI